jgi:NAD(P)-dependent dehydrogenase (short-subunit alcohol dehydrogenase family)
MNDNMDQKTALVTGSTGAIGKAICRQLASKGLQVIILARDEIKAQHTAKEIIAISKNRQVRYEIADLSIHADILALSERWEGPLHVLINNAGITPRTRQENAEGIELQFATNVLGYFRMTQAFQEILGASAPARIVDVASYWAGGLVLDDLEFKQRTYRVGAAYRQSKQANRMLVAAWADRLKPDGITINACHPGDVNSTLSNNLGFSGSQSPDQGAKTPVWLATSTKGGEVTGGYFEDKAAQPDRFTKDRQGVEALFEVCKSFNKLPR